MFFKLFSEMFTTTGLTCVQFVMGEQIHVLICQLFSVSSIIPTRCTCSCDFFHFRESLAFATEPVLASLANILGLSENLPSPLPAHLRSYELYDIEIKYGLMQVCFQFLVYGQQSYILHSFFFFWTPISDLLRPEYFLNECKKKPWKIIILGSQVLIKI